MAKALAGLFPGAAMGKLEAHMMSRDPEVVSRPTNLKMHLTLAIRR